MSTIETPPLLEWGQTPFDEMSRAELKRHLCRCYDALKACRFVLGIAERNDRITHGKNAGYFWENDGNGARAAKKTEQAVRLAEGPYHNTDDGGENVSKAFFRYTDSLLFQPTWGRIWMICDGCKTLLEQAKESPSFGECLCGKQMRMLEWKDMEPSPCRDETGNEYRVGQPDVSPAAISGIESANLSGGEISTSPPP